MSEAPTWRAAQEAAVQLAGRPGDRRTVLLLARLPLLPERVIRRLAGARGSASAYRSLARLRRVGLIAAIRPSLGPGPAPLVPDRPRTRGGCAGSGCRARRAGPPEPAAGQ